MFKNLKKEKEFIDREIDLYKKEKYLEIDKEVEDYRSKRQKEVHDIALLSTEQLGRYEHDFHSNKEEKGIELAKLESKCESLRLIIKAREEVAAADENLLNQMTSEIERLNEIVKLMITNQQTTLIQNMKQ